MKKVFSILAIAFVSLNFVSCREDDVTSEMDVMPQEKVSYEKNVDTIVVDSTKVNSLGETLDPEKDPPKDRTRW